MMLHYTDCGLRNVWLRNGYKRLRTSHGMGTAIDDIAGLHRAIGHWIVKRRARLTGAELRFLRQELDLSQRRLAELLGVEEQTVSLWERRGRMPKLADRFMRAFYQEHVENNPSIRAIVDRLAAKDHGEDKTRSVQFQRRADSWKVAA
jgi:DNA-binding transcriptional regulator YiaG